MNINEIEIIQAGVNDPRFGVVDLYVDRTTGVNYMAKTLKLANIEDLNKAKAQSEGRKTIQHENLLNFIGYQYDEHNLTLTGFFEHHIHDQNWTETNFPLSMWFQSLHEMAKGLAQCQKHHIIHGDIRPSYIYFDTKNLRWVLLDRLSDTASPIQVQFNNFRQDKRLYMAPELFSEIAELNRTHQGVTYSDLKLNYSPYKADSFSLGMSLLEIYINDQSLQSCYNKDSGSFDFELLETIINDIKRHHLNDALISAIISFIAQNMLNSNPKSRLAPKKLNKLIEADIKPIYETCKDNFSNNNERNSAIDWGYGSKLEPHMMNMTEPEHFDVLSPSKTNVDATAPLLVSVVQDQKEESEDPNLELSQKISRKQNSEENENMSEDEKEENDLAVQLKMSAVKNLNLHEVEYEFNFDSCSNIVNDNDRVIVKRANASIVTQPVELKEVITKEMNDEKEFIFIDGHDISTVRNSKENSLVVSTNQIQHNELGTVILEPINDKEDDSNVDGGSEVVVYEGDNQEAVENSLQNDPVDADCEEIFIETNESAEIINDHDHNNFNPNSNQNSDAQRRSTSEFLKNIDEQIRESENYLNSHRFDDKLCPISHRATQLVDILEVKNSGLNTPIEIDNSNVPMYYTQDNIENSPVYDDKPLVYEVSATNETPDKMHDNSLDVPLDNSKPSSPQVQSFDDKIRLHTAGHITKTFMKQGNPSLTSSNLPTVHENSNGVSFYVSRPNPLSVNVRETHKNFFSSHNPHSNYNTLDFSKPNKEKMNVNVNDFQTHYEKIVQQSKEIREPTYVSVRDLTVEKPNNSKLNYQAQKNGFGIDTRDLILVRIENGVNIYRYKEDLNL